MLFEPSDKIGFVPREEVVAMSEAVIARPEIPCDIREEIFRINVAEMDWDIGVMIYAPKDDSRIPRGPEGNRIGLFLLHGGDADFRNMDRLGRVLSGKFGFKVASMTFPGRLYLFDPSRKWPGDTFNPDGTVRMPLWSREAIITPDQYEIKEDKTHRERYGTLFMATAREGTEFYHRMAAWPLAFDEAMQDICRRHFPPGEYSIYAHGHSTGGPFAYILTQRVVNVVGVAGIENTPFGYFFTRMIKQTWEHHPFNEIRIRNWREIARLKGYEALQAEGPQAVLRLPMLIEEVFEKWDRMKDKPNFKAENVIHFDGQKPLEEAARVTARRLKLSDAKTEALVKRYQAYPRELSGPGVKPVPPIVQLLSAASRNHTPKKYQEIAIPMFAAMNPPPRVCVIQVNAGTHMYMETTEADLPLGLCPVAAQMWSEAIAGGYYADYARQWAR